MIVASGLIFFLKLMKYPLLACSKKTDKKKTLVILLKESGSPMGGGGGGGGEGGGASVLIFHGKYTSVATCLVLSGSLQRLVLFLIKLSKLGL